MYESVLITGGRGMLAHAFSELLASRGIRSISVGRDECDVSDPASVVTLFERIRPTLLINCAAYTKVDLAEKEPQQADAVNGTAPGILAAACRRHGTAMVHFSTDYVFDGTFRRPLRPDDPVGPQSAYGKSKLLGEQAIQQNAPARWLIARTAWLYGPGGPNFVQTMVNVAKAGKPLRVINDQIGSPTYTFDLAEATLDLLDHDASGIWHVSNAGQTNWFDFARAIFEEWGLQPDLQPTSSAEWKANKPDSAIRPSYSVLDIKPLTEKIAQPIRPWRDALRAFKSQIDARGKW